MCMCTVKMSEFKSIKLKLFSLWYPFDDWRELEREIVAREFNPLGNKAVVDDNYKTLVNIRVHNQSFVRFVCHVIVLLFFLCVCV